MNADIYHIDAFTSNNILYPTEKTCLKRKRDNPVLAKQRNLDLEHLYGDQPAKNNLMCFITTRNSTSMLVTLEPQSGFLGRKKRIFNTHFLGFANIYQMQENSQTFHLP